MRSIQIYFSGIVLVIFFGLVQSIDLNANLTQLRESFKLINYHIYDKIESGAPEKNVQEAKRWLTSINHNSNSSLIPALELFVELAAVNEPENGCTQHSFSILNANEAATGNRALYAFHQDFAPRRIDKIVHHYCREHAKYCYEMLPNLALSRYRSLNNTGIVCAETAAYYWTLTLNAVQPVASSSSPLSLETINDFPGFRSRFIYCALKVLSKDNKESKFLKKVVDEREGIKVVRKDKVKELVRKYLVEPCKIYFETLDLDRYEGTVEFVRKWYPDQIRERYAKFEKIYEIDQVCKEFVETMENSDLLYKELYNLIEKSNQLLHIQSKCLQTM